MIFEKQVVNLYKGMMHTRCDDTETVFYFSPENFDGLKSEPYSFKSSLGHTLNGYFYSYEGYTEGKLIVFDHGFGGGHRAYMKEIEMLCRHGYRVFSYDHTGCMESEGETPKGLGQSLCDLNDCFNALKNEPSLFGCEFYAMGHSWGAYSTLNISALHPEISKIVVMCGFVSVDEMISTFFAGPLKGYREAVLALEKQSNPIFANFNSIESLTVSKAKALLIYSEDDQLCKNRHYHMLKNALSARENTKFIYVQEKSHNPNYTKEAVKYLNEFGAARAKLARNKKATAEDKANFVASYDWNRMTEQDESVWQEIFAHLDN